MPALPRLRPAPGIRVLRVYAMNDKQQGQDTEERQKLVESTNVDIQPINQDANFKISTERLARGHHWASIISSIIAVAALGFGLFQFSKTQEKQREILDFDREYKTISLFNEYNKTMKEASTKIDKDFPEMELWWVENIALLLAESIYKFNYQGWSTTIEWMLLRHKEFISVNRLDCETYNSDFVKLARKVIQGPVCKNE